MIEKNQTLLMIGLPVQMIPRWLLVPGHLHNNQFENISCYKFVYILPNTKLQMKVSFFCLGGSLLDSPFCNVSPAGSFSLCQLPGSWQGETSAHRCYCSLTTCWGFHFSQCTSNIRKTRCTNKKSIHTNIQICIYVRCDHSLLTPLKN